MANSEIKVGLKFSADVSRAKQDIKSLESSMADLMTAIAKTDPMDSLTDGLGEARKQASMLQAALQQSVNVKTGQFDLSKFSKTLKDYGTNLKEVSANLQKLGPEGEAAFNSLTSSIVSAEIPAKRVNKTFAEFTKQLKNVARYQISTKIYNELVGSLEQAWIYAKNLNRSLNDIRIVTGYSVDDMAKFAEKANAAAKALSSTTNEYAKASLIYFQQGLSDAEVEQRTATTIKLANVTGQSAQEVSNYMTAVWNNFDDGTKSLEYYADAITKLGAATASSSEEIATGLQKFSAVAQSVGLSYEYATSMLATVTSQTRESAETVGTSFKTILARLESLSLGETLDDETTMTKYSQALAKVGVSIKDQTGALKDMDTIIQEIGETWNKISADQRIALAQTVAGMRQYNNFIALMDNYDTFQMNVQLATESEGSLQEQADIYAESWEAATKRVEAAAEELYDKLINDEFFIDLLDTVEGLIDGFSNLVDSMGGLPGLLSSIGFVLTKVFSKQISASIGDFGDRLGGSRKKIIDLKKQAEDLAKQQATNAATAEVSEDAEYAIKKGTLSLQMVIAENEDRLTESQKASLRTLQDQLKVREEQVRQAAAAEDLAIKEYETRMTAIKEETEARKKAAREEALSHATSMQPAYEKQAKLKSYAQEYGVVTESYVYDESSTQEYFGQINELSKKIQDEFDISVDEGAAAFVERLEDIKKTIIDTLHSTDSTFEDKFKEQLADYFTEGNLLDEIEHDQARQFAQETNTDYATSVQIIREIGTEDQQTYSQELAARYREADVAEQSIIDSTSIINKYSDISSDDAMAAAETQAYDIRSNFLTSQDNIELSLKKLHEDIESYREIYSENEPELLAALEQFEQEVKNEAKSFSDDYSIEEHLGEGRTKRNKVIAGMKKLLPDFEAGDSETQSIEEKLKGAAIKKQVSDKMSKEKFSLADREKRRQGQKKRAKSEVGDDQAAKDMLDHVDETREAAEAYKAQIDNFNEQTNRGIQITKQQIDSLAVGFTKAAEGVMGLVSVFNIFKSTLETLNDPNKNFGEKLTASLMATTTILPILISSIKALRDAKMADNLETIKSIALQAKNNTVLVAKNVATWAATAAEKGLKKATDEATEAKWAENAAWYASPILWIPLVIAAAVAAIVGLIAITKKMTDALSASAKAGKELEKAQEQTKNLESALSEAKTEAEALKNTFDEYDSIQLELAKCVQGTDEWTKALNTNNEKVLELMKLYPQLSTMINEAGEAAISRNVQTGALEISDWAIEDLNKQSIQNVNNLNTTTFAARANERRKGIEVKKANIVDSLDTYEIQNSAIESNPLTYLGGAVGAIIEAVQWNKEKGIIEDNIVKLLNLKGDELDEELDALGVSSFNIGEWSDQIEKYATEFPDAAQEIVSAMDANTLAAKAETDALKQQILADNKKVQGSQFANQVIASTSTDQGETVDERVQAEIDELKEDGWGTDHINIASTEKDKQAQTVWKEYAEAAGLGDEVELTGVTGADNNRKFQYKVWDEEAGEYKTKSIDLDSMMRTVASQKANAAIEEEAEKIAELYGRSTKEQVDLMTAAAGDASFLSRSEIAKLAGQGDKLDATTLGLTGEQILAFGGVDAFESALAGNVKKVQEAWLKTTSTMMNATQESLNTLIANQADNEEFAKLTDAQLQIYGTALDTMYQTSGAAVQTSFSSVIDELIANNKNEADKIVEIASNIDWTSGEKGLTEFYNQLRDSGIEIDQSGERWKKLVADMQATPTSLLKHDFEAIREEIATIQKLVNEISFSDIISDEDFKKLRQYSTEIHDMFMMTADGYRFIGKSQELQALALKQSQDVLKESLDINKDAKDALNAFDMFTKDENWLGLSTTENKNTVGSRAMYLRDNKNLTDGMLAQVGFAGGKDALKELISKVYSDDLTVSNDAVKKLQGLYANIAKLEEKNTQGEFDNIKDYQLYASQFTSTADLEENYLKILKEKNLWTKEANEAYKLQWKYLHQLEKERLVNLDLYQDESKALEDLARKQEGLANAKEHATGQDYLSLLKEEIALEEERARVYESGLSDAKGQQQRVVSDLNEVLGDANAPKVKSDENGNITNWEELDRYMATAKVNDDQRKYYEEYKSQVQSAEDKVIEYTEAIRDSEKAQRSMWIESATYAAKYNDTIRDLQLEWLEFQLEAVEDAEFSAALGLSALNDKTRLYAESANDTAASLNNLAAEFNIAPRAENESIVDFIERIKNTAPEASEKISEIMTNYKTSLSEMREADKELAASLVTHFEQVAEKFDKVGQQIENLGKTAEHYRNIVDLVGRDNFDNIEETLDGLNKMEENIAIATLKVSRSKAETLAADIKKVEEVINKAVQEGDMGTAETWRKTWEDLKNQQQAALEEMQSGWESALEAVAAIFEDKTNRILDAFEKSMSGTFGSFDRMSEVFGQQSELNAQYVADYKKVYELSKLTRNIQNQIDNTNSLAAKQSMRELQEEITQLQADGTEMSQYDLEYLQKKYDLRVAEIALEEAQNAKSQVKLQKMSDGSWGYVYTQNADAVANAQQNYEDKLFALQELSTNYLDTTSEQIISTQAEFQEAINAIMTSGLSDEEKRKQIEETVQFYQDRLQFLTSEFDEVIANNQGMANMVQSFGDSMLGAMYPDKEFDSADNIFSQFKEQVGDWDSGTGVMGELKIALTDFQNSTTAIFKEAGYSSMEEFIKGIEDYNSSSKLSDTMSELYDEEGNLKDGVIPGVNGIVNSMLTSRENLQDAYTGMYNDYIEWLDSMSKTKINADGTISLNPLELPEIVEKLDIAEHKTGGYTGAWGPEGKLAILHEKELVLNKQDTENLLHTIEVMDKLIKNIDIGAAAARFSHQLTSVSTSSNKETLQQEVVIHAEFPNATNHSEIEEAFDSLINRAAQYANRNR